MVVECILWCRLVYQKCFCDRQTAVLPWMTSNPVFSFLTGPSAPRDLILIPVPTGATLLSSWESPLSPNGIITAYTLYCTGTEQQFYKDQIVPEQFSQSLVGNVLSTNLEDLLPFTVYECSITASTSAGEGDESPPVMRRTMETCKCILHGTEQTYDFLSLLQHHLTTLETLFLQLSIPHPFTYRGTDPQHPME